MQHIGWVFAWLPLALPVVAQAGGGNRAASDALFNEGRALMAQQRFSEACPKFEASQQLHPGLGTLLNLAECYEKVGKTASAWAEYREAIPLARASGSKVREDLASERARALEPRLSTLIIVAPSGRDLPALEVRRDGVAVLPAELGSAIPVDPGTHTVEASASGKQNWAAKFEVGPDGAQLTVEIPALELARAAPRAAPSKAKKATVGALPTRRTGRAESQTAAAHSGDSQRTVALVVGGVGLVGLGLGSVFGLQAKADWASAKSHCQSYPYGCDEAGVKLHGSAQSKAAAATVAFIAGGAALAAGAVLWFSAGTGKQEPVALGIGPGVAFVRGSFQ